MTVLPATAPKLDLDAVGAVDISGFDGGRRKKIVGGVVVFVMLAILAAAVTMTLLSQS